MELPESLQVVEAFLLPDPSPQGEFDTFPAALCRRLQNLTQTQVAEGLHGLIELGLVSGACEVGAVAPWRTSNLRLWLTDPGWVELGLVTGVVN